MEAMPKPDTSSQVSLQLLLFVDRRPASAEKIRQIRTYIKEHQSAIPMELQVIDVTEQPHLAEHFKLVATPTLIKLYPEPRQVLAGSNIVHQLERWWERWQRSVEDYIRQHSDELSAESADPPRPEEDIGAIAYSAEVMRLSDEIFRLKQEKDELREQLNFKDRLIAMLAHDLRNPLTAVSIALETLELGISQSGEARSAHMTPALMNQLLKHARTQTKAIDRMITDILQIAKGTDGDFVVQPHRLDLRSLCLDVLERLKPQFGLKAQQVKTDIPADLPFVYADAERIQQVLVNLLDNATKYSPDGGIITLSILHRTTQKVQVSICDDGPGIPNENRERIFEDRFRLQRDEGKEGYGIGLALCQRIIRAHYGQIWVDSSPNEGSCFHFTLPVHRS
jgi:two-component system clock-associated histidine kinase SasA